MDIKYWQIQISEVTDLLSDCEKQKKKQKYARSDIQHLCNIEEEEVAHMFHNLEVWAETENHYIKKNNVKVLLDYYKQT